MVSGERRSWTYTAGVATRRGRPTQAEAKVLDHTIRQAAVATFLEFGYDGTSMDAIARTAGITRRSLYARYADKRAVFVDVIPWALTRFVDSESIDDIDGDDLAAALTSLGRVAITRAVDPDNVRLKRVALNESARFPEFAITADSMMWAGRQRALTELLHRHHAEGNIRVDDVELAAEHFLAMVEAVPGRLADFGIHRTKEQHERHLRQAVELFLHGVITPS
jgi:AcrR family transcriptional regulator